jgi:hypothetical protein
MPMRSSMRLSAATPVLRSGIACCTATRSSPRRRRWQLEQHAVAGGLDDTT